MATFNERRSTKQGMERFPAWQRARHRHRSRQKRVRASRSQLRSIAFVTCLHYKRFLNDIDSHDDYFVVFHCFCPHRILNPFVSFVTFFFYKRAYKKNQRKITHRKCQRTETDTFRLVNCEIVISD